MLYRGIRRSIMSNSFYIKNAVAIDNLRDDIFDFI